MSDVESGPGLMLQRLSRLPVVAIVRASEPETAMSRATALMDGGLTVVEVSLTTPGALDVIARLVDVAPEGVSVGAGTVLTVAQARDVAAAGAGFMVSPGLDEDVVTTSKGLGLAAVPGCMTPTEMLRATNCGADAVKIFPADLWSPTALKGILEPLPYLRCVPTGGIGAHNAREWLDAGAYALGIASSFAVADPRAAAVGMREAVLPERRSR